ncbi:RNase H domain-containing protein [Abeliophyllum distichum]|uniref:RNase H domain-containing protein n=1 Tax=Abeliophyllum distichum TaxID=126358 RepID=A0ABD1TY92_9LAMI
MTETWTRQGPTSPWKPPVREINTIKGGPYIGGHTMNSRRNYSKAAREEPMESWQVHGHRPIALQILFTEEDEAGIPYPHCDSLVVLLVVARNGLVPRGRITLAVDFGEPLYHLRKFMNFLIVDTRSAYHEVLGRPTVEGFAGSHIHTSLGNEVSDAGRGRQDSLAIRQR